MIKATLLALVSLSNSYEFLIFDKPIQEQNMSATIIPASTTASNQIILNQEEIQLIKTLRSNKKEEAINEFINNPDVQQEALQRLQELTTGGVLTTKSYKIGNDYVEFILDLVAYKRSTGHINFTQTKVLHMALDRLKEELPPIPPRSEAVRKEAMKRNAIIKNAIKSTKEKKEVESN